MRIFRNGARALFAGTPDKDTLHGVANNFAGYTAGPANRRTVETATLPPVRIEPGSVHRRLEAACKRLSKLIAGHEQSLATHRRLPHETQSALDRACSSGADFQCVVCFFSPVRVSSTCCQCSTLSGVFDKEFKFVVINIFQSVDR